MPFAASMVVLSRLVRQASGRTTAPLNGGTKMVPILLWILGVPGLIILLLLILGVLHL